MKRIVGGMLTLALAALVAGPLPGEDAKKPEKKAEAYAGLFSFGKKITLDKKQQDSLAALKAEYAPKLAEVDKKMAPILTPERRKTAEEARKKALGEGTKGKELAKVYMDALKLTPEEKKELGPINKVRNALVKEINEKKMALLTAEQKEGCSPRRTSNGPRRNQAGRGPSAGRGRPRCIQRPLSASQRHGDARLRLRLGVTLLVGPNRLDRLQKVFRRRPRW